MKKENKVLKKVIYDALTASSSKSPIRKTSHVPMAEKVLAAQLHKITVERQRKSQTRYIRRNLSRQHVHNSTEVLVSRDILKAVNRVDRE